MTTDEKLDLILSKMDCMSTDIQSMKADINSMKADIISMKADIDSMKADIVSMKADIVSMKADIQLLKKKVADIELHLENTTDWNIKLLAESHTDLIDKLNQAIPYANKNLIYEVKVSYLIGEVENLKREVEKLKNRIA